MFEKIYGFINRKQEEWSNSKEGKNELQIVIVPMIKAFDGKYISSSRIRKKEIDSKGNLT